eukprot:scaffold27_cov125-Isochrysis_galbana.AAC.3
MYNLRFDSSSRVVAHRLELEQTQTHDFRSLSHWVRGPLCPQSPASDAAAAQPQASGLTAPYRCRGYAGAPRGASCPSSPQHPGEQLKKR